MRKHSKHTEETKAKMRESARRMPAALREKIRESRLNTREKRVANAEKVGRFSREQVFDILSDPRPWRAIAESYGCPHITIRSIKRGQCYVIWNAEWKVLQRRVKKLFEENDRLRDLALGQTSDLD